MTSPLWVAVLTVGSALSPLRMEWLAVLLGIALTLVGLAAALTASIRLVRLVRPGTAVVPVGALVYAVLPVAWEYSSSGLEGGLDRAWLGVTFACLVRRVEPDAGQWVDDRRLAAVVGLAPLIRPDFVVFWLAMAGLALATATGDGRVRRSVTWMIPALAPGLLNQAFRMGYYAAILPNTAYAKEPSAVLPSRGWRYLTDFVGPTWVWLPVVVLCVVGLVPLLRDAGQLPRARVVVAAITAAGLVHMSYVVVIGGDFMRGRMLLPGLFAVLMPVAVLPVRRATLVAGTFVGAWAVLAAVVLRPPKLDVAAAPGIASPREFMILMSGNPHPVTTDDHASALVRATHLVGPGVYQGSQRLAGESGPLETRAGEPSIVIIDYAVGLSSYTQPTDVHVLDALGLGDAFTSHLALESRGRAGHEKVLPATWIWARLVDPSMSPRSDLIAVPDLLIRGAGTTAAPLTDDQFASDVKAAQAALRCAPLRRLDEATTAPLTLGRVVRNVGDALRLHGLRIPSDPHEAELTLCDHGG